MRRDEQIHRLSMAIEAVEQALDHLREAHASGFAQGMATVAAVRAKAQVMTVLEAMVEEEVAA